MNQWVEISFDCLPLRSVGRLDIPLDASPKYRERCLRVKAALEKHGSHNTYFLYNAQCIYRLTNRDDVGMIQFTFEGTHEGTLTGPGGDIPATHRRLNGRGVQIFRVTIGPAFNSVQGNFIGVDTGGTAALGNGTPASGGNPVSGTGLLIR